MYTIDLNMLNLNTWVNCIRGYHDDANELLLTFKKFERMYNNDDDFLMYLIYTYMCYLQGNIKDSQFRYVFNLNFDKNNLFKNFNKNYALKIIKMLKKYTPNYYKFLNKKNSIFDKILAIMSNIILRDNETSLLTLIKNSKDDKSNDAFNKDYEFFMKNYIMKKIPLLNELRHYFKTTYLQTFFNNFKNIGCLSFNDIKNIELYSINNVNKLNYMPIESLLYSTVITSDFEYIREYITPNFLNAALLLSCIWHKIDDRILLAIKAKNNNHITCINHSVNNGRDKLCSKMFSYMYPPYEYLNLLKTVIFFNVLYKDNTRQLILNLKDKFKVYNINDKFNIKNSKDLYLTIFARGKPDSAISNQKINYTDVIFDGNIDKFLIEFIYFYKEEYNNRYENINIENINKFLTIDVENNKFIFDDEKQFMKLIGG